MKVTQAVGIQSSLIMFAIAGTFGSACLAIENIGEEAKRVE